MCVLDLPELLILTFLSTLVSDQSVLAQFLQQFVNTACLQVGHGSHERARTQFVIFHQHFNLKQHETHADENKYRFKQV